MVGLETEINMIVSGREDLIKQEAPLLFEISSISNDIGKIQEALKARVESRARYVSLCFNSLLESVLPPMIVVICILCYYCGYCYHFLQTKQNVF